MHIDHLKEQRIKILKADKLFTWQTGVLVFVGLCLNIGFAQLALLFNIPLFLDSIGTVLVSALGGLIPGIFIAFISNLINAIGEPITLYYGILNILIAIATYSFSKQGLLKNIFCIIVLIFTLAVIGGVVGSLLTWMLFGFNMGSGISAPFATLLFENYNFSPFMAQLTADFAIDICDKAIVVILVLLLLYFFPTKIKNYFPLGHIHNKILTFKEYRLQLKEKIKTRQKSINNKIIFIIVLCSLVLSACSIFIGLKLYREKAKENYTSICQMTINLSKNYLNGDKITQYLTDGIETPDYLENEQKLIEISNSIDDIAYLYVYQIREDGCYVVFDLDTPELQGEALGGHIDFDEEFLPQLDKLLAGQKISPVESRTVYGWLMTIYEPITDSSGACVAYIGVDVDMHKLLSEEYEFIIRLISLLFGISIIVIAFTLWFNNKQIIIPLKKLVYQSRIFDLDENSRDIYDQKQRLEVKTGDEFEELYKTMCKTEDELEKYIGDIKLKNKEIRKLQINTIHSFADMVESRDICTGNHIKNTSSYVKIIAEQMQKNPKYKDIITKAYLEKLVLSSPLHDLGKIKISDTILNKPGKLTEEEFEAIKTHTTFGYEIIERTLRGIKDQDYLAIAKNMALYHHEKWNGKGYPKGISGEKIPLCARIMAVADVFDALVSKRSYKNPFSFDESVEIIKNESGSHFSPDVVDAFMQSLDKIKEVLNKHTSEQ